MSSSVGGSVLGASTLFGLSYLPFTSGSLLLSSLQYTFRVSAVVVLVSTLVVVILKKAYTYPTVRNSLGLK
jgi:hypothetical protein